MKQVDFVNAYTITNKLSQSEKLTISGKWALYKLRKDLLPHYEFYVEESRKLFNEYESYYNPDNDAFDFESMDDAKVFKTKQDAIDDFEVEFSAEKPRVKLSDIPDITVPQIEKLDNFIEFIPE